MRERIDQAKREIDGVAAQLAAKARQKELTDEELGGVEKLYRQNLVAMSRLTGLQRDEARLLGEEGSLTAETARIRGRIAERQLQILQIDQDMRRNVSEESRDVEGKIADLSERRIAAADILNRVDIRAPQTGIVLQNSVHTIGGVVGPGEQIMLIVPEQDGLVVEARIDPTMIDRVQSGQDVLVRFPAFDAATTPTLQAICGPSAPTSRQIPPRTRASTPRGLSWTMARSPGSTVRHWCPACPRKPSYRRARAPLWPI